MANGFSKCFTFKCFVLASLLFTSLGVDASDYRVKVTSPNHDVKDLSQRTSSILDQNGEKCALIKFETAVPALISFDLGAQEVEKRENKDDEVWIWVSADVKKITVQCQDCTPQRDWRISMEAGNVYRAKITTGLPQETSTKQNMNIYCEQVPFMISIDGAAPVKSESKNYYAELAIGSHELIVSSDYYKPYQQTIRLLRSNAYNDTIQLERNYGEIVINSSLSDLTVRVDEIVREERIIKMEPGTHLLSISKDRYEPLDTRITVALGERRVLPVSLVPAFAAFNITTTTEQTEIWVDGEEVGHDKAVVELTFGEHTIQGRRPGYDTYELPQHDFDADSPRKITIPKLNQQFGSVRLSVFPTDATLYFDGKPVTTSLGVYSASQINTGIHYVHVRMTDYTSRRDTLFVNAGDITARDYPLEYIARGTVSISTDEKIGIYQKREDGELIYLGRGSFSGKLPVGENVIVLKDWTGMMCEYHCMINLGNDNPSLTLPFQRSLILRTNVSGVKVAIRPEHDTHYRPIKPNKKLKLDPLKYEVMATRKNYMDYKDSIDLTREDQKEVIHHITMRTFADTYSTDTSVVLKQHHTRHDFYDRAGRWYIGVIQVGYNFSFAPETSVSHYAHTFSAAFFPFRYKMFGMSLLEVEYAYPKSGKEMFGLDAPYEEDPKYGRTYDEADEIASLSTLVYKPTMSLVLPASKGFAFTFYGGVALNLVHFLPSFTQASSENQKFYRKKIPQFSALGGMSLLFNYVGWLPMNIFAEYRYPFFRGEEGTFYPYKDSGKEQFFRVGLNFSVGVDR